MDSFDLENFILKNGWIHQGKIFIHGLNSDYEYYNFLKNNYTNSEKLETKNYTLVLIYLNINLTSLIDIPNGWDCTFLIWKIKEKEDENNENCYTKRNS